MTLTIETVYDPNTSRWYAEGYALSAKTLREMLALLPGGSVIVGYHPNGYGLPPLPKVAINARSWEYEGTKVREVDAKQFRKDMEQVWPDELKDDRTFLQKAFDTNEHERLTATGRTPSKAPAESQPPKLERFRPSAANTGLATLNNKPVEIPPVRSRFTAQLTSDETAAALENELKPDLFRPEPVKDLGRVDLPAKLQPTRSPAGKGKPTMALVDWADAEPKMKQMFRDGFSVREAAAKLGTTRGAVIGRCQRRGIPLPGTQVGRKLS